MAAYTPKPGRSAPWEKKDASGSRRDGNIPQSGVPGVSWRKNGKWQATYKRHYLGVFGTVEEAAEVIEKYKNSHEKW